MATVPDLNRFKEFIDDRSAGSDKDSEMQSALDAGIEWAEERVGPLEVRNFDVTRITRGGAVTVPAVRPVTLISVTDHNGNEVAVQWFDTSTGQALLPRLQRGPTRFQGTHGWGDDLPASVVEAALVVAAMNYRQRRAARGVQIGSEEPRAGMPRAMQLIGPYAQPAIG